MVLKKDLVAQARAHNKKVCINQISSKTKGELSRSLRDKGVAVPSTSTAPVKNLGFTAMFKKAASAPARPTLKAPAGPRPYERGLAPRPTGPPATPFKKTRRGKRGGAKKKKK